MSRAPTAVFEFERKLGAKPVQSLLKVYRSKCISLSSYGCDIWGYKMMPELLAVENNFLKRLVVVPQSTAFHIVHDESGAGYRSDLLALCQVVRWLRIWANPELIKDCLSLENGSRIHLFNYIRSVMDKLDRHE
ncbi:hypothetical protein NDU88_009641 [Pleurodeles waltl]|uniref:Uncharacterized protein n=1 Tax=Pleurodeles waltl TaxID=8319 RepID=A0AAV7PST0_PLEWA|nr:hypothetical protein NDU88_009641 [Pleurodeles waltl]